MPSKKVSLTDFGSNKINDKQKLFVLEYLVDLSPTKAAKRAGYSSANAGKLMSNPEVRKAIGKALKQILVEPYMSAKELVAQLHHIMYLDPLHFLDQGEAGDITLRDMELIPEPIRKCITKMKIRKRTYTDGTAETTYDLEFFSKEKAADMLAKYYKLYEAEDEEEALEGEVKHKKQVESMLGKLLKGKGNPANVLSDLPQHTEDNFDDFDVTSEVEEEHVSGDGEDDDEVDHTEDFFTDD